MKRKRDAYLSVAFLLWNHTSIMSVSKTTVRRVNQILIESYGEREPHARDPLDGLILIILSQATSDVNCDRAFSSLKSAFPTWDKCLAAPVEHIANAIRSGGLANQKAARIKRLLGEIFEERGDFDLSWMHQASADECETYLSKFHGVGPKTVACVLVFFLGKPAFPVDTHVFRVCKRLGWLREKSSPEEAHRVLKPLVPDDCKLDLHVNFIAHGRVICRAAGNGGPKCSECSIRRFCEFGKSVKAEDSTKNEGNSAAKRDPDFFVTIKQKKVLERVDEVEELS
ncbi:endonuclease-3 [Abditibacterium utsteinense]|uniref:Endonuclease-3 n=1 Tax=Abditibacterium utsteinense TaxID=1960156 RepID=A0A2S8SPL6_9BACT|nr:endonuclease III [Abditibacterium utsteinense]PQV62743.1 endonuclease-3 [Abditibacterium utsteinense]